MHRFLICTCLQVRSLPTAQDVLRCELVNKTWRSASTSMYPLLPPTRLHALAVAQASQSCCDCSAPRLSSLQVAFTKGSCADAADNAVTVNENAVGVLAFYAKHLTAFVIDDVGAHSYTYDFYLALLTSLTRLELNNSGMHTLPSAFGKLTGLQNLRINTFTQICNMADGERAWVQGLTKLTLLQVTLTNRFEEIGGPLPDTLQHLILNKTPSLLELPTGMSRLTDLRSLTISGNIWQLPADLGLLPQLSRPSFNVCDRLLSLPEKMSEFTSIKHITVICNALERSSRAFPLPGYMQATGVKRIPGLGYLALSVPCYSYMLEGLVPAASLSSLTSLHIYHCPVLASSGMQGLESYLARLTALRCLQLAGVSRVESIDCVSALTALTALKFEGAEHLGSLPSLEQLGRLQRLVLRGCSKVAVLPVINGLLSLKHLELQDMLSLRLLPQDLGDLACLKELIVYYCPGLRKFPSSLEKLHFQLFSIGSLNERCPVARKRVAKAKQQGAYRYATDLGLGGGSFGT